HSPGAGSSVSVQRAGAAPYGAADRGQGISLRHAVRDSGGRPVLQYSGFLRAVEPVITNYQCGRPGFRGSDGEQGNQVCNASGYNRVRDIYGHDILYQGGGRRLWNHCHISNGRGETAVGRSAETVNGMSELCVL